LGGKSFRKTAYIEFTLIYNIYLEINHVHNLLRRTGIASHIITAVYGIPVIFGPKYQKFMEAVQLLEAKGAYSIKDYIAVNRG